MRKKRGEVESEFSTQIAIDDDVIPGTDFLMTVTGDPFAVDRSIEYSLKLMKEVRIPISIPYGRDGRPMVGVAIGPQGKTMEGLRLIDKSVRIQLPEGSDCTAVVYGPSAGANAVANALRNVYNIPAQHGATTASGAPSKKSDHVELSLEAPKDDWGQPVLHLLIGKGGETVNWLRAESGADLRVPPMGQGSAVYTVSGTAAQVLRIRKLIRDIFADELGEGKVPPVVAPVQMTSQGPKHVSTAKNVVASRLTRPSVPRPGTAPPTAGAAPRPKKAANPADLGEMGKLDLPIDGQALKKKIPQLEEMHRVKINLEDGWILLEGREKSLAAAEEHILRLSGQVKGEVPIPQSQRGEPMIGLVIGPKGSKIGPLRDNHGQCQILLPDDGNGRKWGHVTVYGPITDAQGAVNDLMAMLGPSSQSAGGPPSGPRPNSQAGAPGANQGTYDMPVDNKGRALTHVLVGRGGENVRWLRQETDGVNVTITRDQEPVQYTLSGTAQQVQEAERLIQILFDDNGQSTAHRGQIANPHAMGTVVR